MTLSGVGRPDARSAGLGAVAGVLAAGVALGVGQLVAGLTGASGSPVVVVGELQIDFTPPWLKNFAITEFGADDKLVLVTGIVVVLGAFAALVGAAATRRMAYGMAGIAVFAAVGLTAAATRPDATVASLLPTLAATAWGWRHEAHARRSHPRRAVRYGRDLRAGPGQVRPSPGPVRGL